MTVLHQMADAAKADAYLFKPEDAYRMPGGGAQLPRVTASGQNPPAGAVIYYYLKEKPKGDLTLEILDAAGKSVKKFTSKAPEGQATPAPTGGDEGFFGGGGGASRPPVEAGLNRFVWNFRYPDAMRFPGLIMWAGDTSGPRVVPGAYQVRLTVGDKTLTQSFEVKKDPRLDTTPEDFAKQFELLTKIRDKVNEMHDAILKIRDVRKQVDDVTGRVKDQTGGKTIADAAKTLKTNLTAIEEELYQTKNQSSQDPLNYPIRLNNKLAALTGVVGSADAAPTAQSYAVYDDLVKQIDAQLAKLDQVMKTELPAFNKLVHDQDIPAVVVKAKASSN
jgi:hypothetical protein